jgi:hypothetical protein
MNRGRLRHAVGVAVRCGGRVGAAKARRGVEVLDDAERARRARIRTSVDGILRGLAGRYGLDLDPAAFASGGAYQPGNVG